MITEKYKFNFHKKTLIKKYNSVGIAKSGVFKQDHDIIRRNPTASLVNAHIGTCLSDSWYLAI